MYENRGELLGCLTQTPAFGYESYGKRYYLAPLEVLRLSGTADRVNLAIEEPLLSRFPPEGEPVHVFGELRSFNNRSGEGNRLVITVLVRQVMPAADTEPHINRMELGGVLCKTPVLRRTPMGREICDMILAVNRRFGRSDYIPCIAWGRLAQSIAACGVGDPLHLLGRLQSRKYQKLTEDGIEERTAFELSVMELGKTVE